MNANELRVGNIVEIIHVDYGRKINAIDVYDLVSIHEVSESLSFHPIPLTKEWLIKFGARDELGAIWVDITKDKDPMFVSYNFESKSVYLYKNTIEEDLFKKQIKFVHQLQNLYFALTGEELTLQDINSENANKQD